jgi:hypothetical protein
MAAALAGAVAIRTASLLSMLELSVTMQSTKGIVRRWA